MDSGDNISLSLSIFIFSIQDYTANTVDGPPFEPAKDQTTTSAPKQPTTEGVEKVSTNQRQPLETTTAATSTTTTKTDAMPLNAATLQPTSVGRANGEAGSQEQLTKPITSYNQQTEAIQTTTTTTTTTPARTTETSSTTADSSSSSSTSSGFGQTSTSSKPVEPTTAKTSTTIKTENNKSATTAKGNGQEVEKTTTSFPITNQAGSLTESNDGDILPSDDQLSKGGSSETTTTTTSPNIETAGNFETTTAENAVTSAPNATTTNERVTTAENEYETTTQFSQATTQSLESTALPQTTASSKETTTNYTETTTQPVQSTIRFPTTIIADKTTKVSETITGGSKVDTEYAQITATTPTTKPNIGEMSAGGQQTTANIPYKTTTSIPSIKYTTSSANGSLTGKPGVPSISPENEATTVGKIAVAITASPVGVTTDQASQSNNETSTSPFETKTASTITAATTNDLTTKTTETPYGKTTATSELGNGDVGVVTPEEQTTAQTTTRPTLTSTTANKNGSSEGSSNTQQKPSISSPSTKGNADSQTYTAFNTETTTTSESQGGYSQPTGNEGSSKVNVTTQPIITATTEPKSETEIQTTERPVTTASDTIATTTKEAGVSIEQPTEAETTTTPPNKMNTGVSAGNQSWGVPIITQIKTVSAEALTSLAAMTTTTSKTEEEASTEVNNTSSMTAQIGMSSNQAMSASGYMTGQENTVANQSSSKETAYDRYVREFYAYYKSLALQATAVNKNQPYFAQEQQLNQSQQQNEQKQQSVNPLYIFQASNNETEYMEGKETDDTTDEAIKPAPLGYEYTTTTAIPKATAATTVTMLPIVTTTMQPVNLYQQTTTTTTTNPYPSPTRMSWENSANYEKEGNSTSDLYVDGKEEEDSIYFEVLNQTAWNGKESYGNPQQQRSGEYQSTEGNTYNYNKGERNFNGTTTQAPAYNVPYYTQPSKNQSTTQSYEEYMRGKDEEEIYQEQNNPTTPNTNNIERKPTYNGQYYTQPSYNQSTTQSNEEYMKGKEEEDIYQGQNNPVTHNTNITEQKPPYNGKYYTQPSNTPSTTQSNEEYMKGKEQENIYQEQNNPRIKNANTTEQKPTSNNQYYTQPSYNQPTTQSNEEYMKGKEDIYQGQNNPTTQNTNTTEQKPAYNGQYYTQPSNVQSTTQSNEEYMRGKDEEDIYQEQSFPPTTQNSNTTEQKPTYNGQYYTQPSYKQPTTQSNEEYMRGKDEEDIYQEQSFPPTTQNSNTTEQKPTYNGQYYTQPSYKQPTTQSNEEYMRGKDEEDIYQEQSFPPTTQNSNTTEQKPTYNGQYYTQPSYKQPTTQSYEEYMRGKDEEDVYQGQNNPTTQNTNIKEQKPTYSNQYYTQPSYNQPTTQSNEEYMRGKEEEDFYQAQSNPTTQNTNTTEQQQTYNSHSYTQPPSNQSTTQSYEEYMRGKDEEGIYQGQNNSIQDVNSFNVAQGGGAVQGGSSTGHLGSSNSQGVQGGQPMQSQGVLTGTAGNLTDTSSKEENSEDEPSPPPYYPQEATVPTTKPFSTTKLITKAWGSTQPLTTNVQPTTANQRSYNSNAMNYMEGKENEQVLYQTTTQPPLYQTAGMQVIHLMNFLASATKM